MKYAWLNTQDFVAALLLPQERDKANIEAQNSDYDCMNIVLLTCPSHKSWLGVPWSL